MPEQQQQSGQQESSLELLWIIGIIVACTYLGWYFGKAYIVSALFHVRFYEIAMVSFVLNIFTKLIPFIDLSQSQLALNEAASFIQQHIHGRGVTFSTLINVSTVAGDYTKYFFALLTFGAAAALYFGSSSNKFHHIFNTQSLKQLEQDNWPQIKPIVNLDLVKKGLDEQPWAMALSPMNFCKKNNLLDIETKNGKYIATLRRGAAHRILSLQLGPKWEGLDSLSLPFRALFAIFAACANDDKKGAENLLDKISNSAAGSSLDFSGVDELLRKHVSAKSVGRVVGLHGYVTSVFASMLVAARSTGVLATAEFIWLKPIDRRMWYMLNSVGRPTAVAEISGAFAHWLAEKKLGLPLMAPMVEEAVRGLEQALADMIYTPDEEE